jgi:ribosomal protein L15
MSYDLAVLEQQIWRMENPHQLAQERLGKVGHGLLTYATALEDAVEKAGVQLVELRSGFDAEIAEFEQVAESVRARAVDSGETLRAQAEELSATAARIAANLEQIRGTGKDEALAIDGASERATASLRELIEAMRGQIESLEENFQQAVENTVGRVSGAGNAASEDIRSAADLVVSRTQDVVDSVRQ